MCFAPGDADALAREMARLVEHPALRRELGERGRARARVFAWPAISERVRDVYVRALEQAA